jgi:hypothetical protein
MSTSLSYVTSFSKELRNGEQNNTFVGFYAFSFNANPISTICIYILHPEHDIFVYESDEHDDLI